jgi:hypothetical protein
MNTAIDEPQLNPASGGYLEIRGANCVAVSIKPGSPRDRSCKCNQTFDSLRCCFVYTAYHSLYWATALTLRAGPEQHGAGVAVKSHRRTWT